MKKLTGADANNVIERLNGKLQNINSTILSRNNVRTRTSGQSIDYSTILQIIDSLGIKNYTFKILNHPDDNYKTFHNLVVTEKEDAIKATIMKYEMTDLFAQEYSSGQKEFYKFQGKIVRPSLSMFDEQPCPEKEWTYPPLNSTGDPTTGGGTGSGGVGQTGGGEEAAAGTGSTGAGGDDVPVFENPVSFQCNSCNFSADTWEAFSTHTDNEGVIYSFTVTLNFKKMSNITINTDPCNPDGRIGVIEPEDDCNSFEKRIIEVLNTEGGFVNDPLDPGGLTNKGITWAVWLENAYLALGVQPTLENLQALNDNQAKIIYKNKYWDKVRCDEINDGDLRYLLFDFHVNAGKNAVKVLKKTLVSLGYNLTINGTMDDETIQAINDCTDIKSLYNTYKTNRQLYHQDIVDRSVQKYLAAKPNATQLQINTKTQKKWINGWTNRVNKFLDKTVEQLINVNC